MKSYILVVWNDIEPEVLGPFPSEESRIEAARNIRQQDPDKDHGIYWLEAEGNVEVACFTGGVLDTENESSGQDGSHAAANSGPQVGDEVYWQDPARETSGYGVVIRADHLESLFLKMHSGSEVEAFQHECLKPGPDDTEIWGAEDFRNLYGHWGCHPDHFVSEWIEEVQNKDTRLGYWEWVAAREYDG